jgi:glycosyltransferase involved in cell wall biosynthesis
VSAYTAALDVACLVPKSNEGFSNSVLEKMALGLPLVVTDMGGNREAVEHGTNGYVIRPGDREALVEALSRLAKDPERRRQMGQASRQRVEALFSLEQMIARHQELYLSLCGDALHA